MINERFRSISHCPSSFSRRCPPDSLLASAHLLSLNGVCLTHFSPPPPPSHGQRLTRRWTCRSPSTPAGPLMSFPNLNHVTLSPPLVLFIRLSYLHPRWLPHRSLPANPSPPLVQTITFGPLFFKSRRSSSERCSDFRPVYEMFRIFYLS